MATRTKWLLLILAVMLIPVPIVPTVLVGMSTNLGQLAADWFAVLMPLLAFCATALYLIPIKVPRLRRWAYGPELAEHFNDSERKPLAERYMLSWSAVWLFFAVGNLIRSVDRLDDVSDWNIWDAIATITIPVSIVLMFITFRYKRALDRLAEEVKRGEGT
jgi:hypothetical protein